MAQRLLGRGRPSFADAAYVEQLTDILVKQALMAAGCTRVEDLAVVSRAVVYITRIHATGQFADKPLYVMEYIQSTEWFFNMMLVLVELTCPNCGQTKASAAFYDDIERGIAEGREV